MVEGHQQKKDDDDNNNNNDDDDDDEDENSITRVQESEWERALNGKKVIRDEKMISAKVMGT